MNEIVKKEEVLDIEVIEKIESIEQADEILELCNSQDSKVIDIYVHNAITRGAVYHKLTEVGNGGLGLLNDQVAKRYNTSDVTIGKYINVYENMDIILRLDSELSNSDSVELKPTLKSLLEIISKDENKVNEKILSNISHNKMSADTERVILEHLENAGEEERYIFSKNHSVSYGVYRDAIIRGADEPELIEILKRNGNRKVSKGEMTNEELRAENAKLKSKVEQLEEENEMLRKRNKFLLDSNSVDTVRDLLRRANRNKEGLRQMKPSLINAINVLGVDVSVTEGELKKAYREKVGKAHPDMGGSDEEFRKIAEANRLIKEFIKGL